jgi:hypothetical protein
MKLPGWSVVLGCLLSGGAYVYWAQTVPPSCSSQTTTNLVKKILVEQFSYPANIEISNIRTTLGGLFASRFECDATIDGDLSGQAFGGLEMRAVHYTSEITEDTHRHYVTAKPQALIKSDPYPNSVQHSSGPSATGPPSEGLPTYIANALRTPNLAPGNESPAKRELVLGSEGQKQFIPAIKLDEDCGASSCTWDILDSDTQQIIFPSGSGGLYKTQKITNGYYDVIVVDGTAIVENIFVYEYLNGKYENTSCYERNINPAGPAGLTSCP